MFYTLSRIQLVKPRSSETISHCPCELIGHPCEPLFPESLPPHPLPPTNSNWHPPVSSSDSIPGGSIMGYGNDDSFISRLTPETPSHR